MHFNIRLEDDRLCTVVMIGALPNCAKELLAIDGRGRLPGERRELEGGAARAQSGGIFDNNTRAAGEVTAEPFGKKGFSGRYVRTRCETGLSRRRWRHRGPNPTKTLQRRGRPAYAGVAIGEPKRKFPLKLR
jgi:hypothetical protein